MASRTKAKATPKQLRRTGYLVAAIAAFVAISSIYTEIEYASFEQTATRLRARIVKIEAVREGKRLRHVLHYEFDHGGKTHRFSDKGARDSKLGELYAGTFNAFMGADPPLRAGGTIALLVDPSDAKGHRPDRATLPLPSALWVPPLLGVLFMSGVAGFLFWIAREPPRAGSSAPPPPKTRRSQVNSSREAGLLRITAKVGVPWPDSSTATGRAPPPANEPASSAEIRFELDPDEDAQLYEARVDFIGGAGEQASEVVQRAITLRAGAIEKLAATVKIPSAAKTLRLTLVLADRTTWQHDVAL